MRPGGECARCCLVGGASAYNTCKHFRIWISKGTHTFHSISSRSHTSSFLLSVSQSWLARQLVIGLIYPLLLRRIFSENDGKLISFSPKQPGVGVVVCSQADSHSIIFHIRSTSPFRSVSSAYFQVNYTIIDNRIYFATYLMKTGLLYGNHLSSCVSSNVSVFVPKDTRSLVSPEPNALSGEPLRYCKHCSCCRHGRPRSY